MNFIPLAMAYHRFGTFRIAYRIFENQTAGLGFIRQTVKKHQIFATMTMNDLNTALRYADPYIL
jgi:hypothetical protein